MQYRVPGFLRLSSLVVSLVTGCFSPGDHVQLRSPPPPTAPLPEREAAYEELRPHTQVDTVVFQNGQRVTQQPDFIMLRDGRRVYRAEDLGAVVSPHSPTAQAGQRSKRAAERIHNWQVAGYVVGGIGVATTLVSAATFPEPGAEGFGTHGAIFGAGIVIAGVGLAIAVYGMLGNAREFSDERATAFALYDEDLKRTLDLCLADTSIVACPPRTGVAGQSGGLAPAPRAPGDPLPPPTLPPVLPTAPAAPPQ